MTQFQYGQVTSVFTDDENGAQLCNVIGGLTKKEFQKCEIIVSKGLLSLPKIGDTVLLAEINNTEFAVIGIIEQKNLELLPGEILIYSDERLKIKVNKDEEFEIRFDDEAVQVKIAKDHLLYFKTDNKVTIEAPLVEII